MSDSAPLQQLIESIDHPVYVVDHAGGLLYANREARRRDDPPVVPPAEQIGHRLRPTDRLVRPEQHQPVKTMQHSLDRLRVSLSQVFRVHAPNRAARDAFIAIALKLASRQHALGSELLTAAANRFGTL